MKKKIEVDVDMLREIGLSNSQINNIVRKAEPDNWITKLPVWDCYSIKEFEIYYFSQTSYDPFIDFDLDPKMNFYSSEDAVFITNKCRLLVEMSNYAFAVNKDWIPDWNNKEQKKFGIVMLNGKAVLRENELFNVFVFGICFSNKVLAHEMLKEFQDRIEIYFCKNFNSTIEILNPKKATELLEEHKIESKESAPLTLFAKEVGFEDNNFTHQEINLDSPSKEVVVKVKKRKIKFDENKIPFILECINKGVTQKEIANMLGCSQSKLSALKRSLGFKSLPKPNNDFIPEEKIPYIKDMISKGVSQTEIAKNIGCTQAKLSRFKKILGLPLVSQAPKFTFSEENISFVKQSLAKGISQSKIAKALGCSQIAISQLKLKHGFEGRGRIFKK